VNVIYSLDVLMGCVKYRAREKGPPKNALFLRALSKKEQKQKTTLFFGKKGGTKKVNLYFVVDICL